MMWTKYWNNYVVLSISIASKGVASMTPSTALHTNPGVIVQESFALTQGPRQVLVILDRRGPS